MDIEMDSEERKKLNKAEILANTKLRLIGVKFLNKFSLDDYINKKFDLEIEKYNMKI